MSSDNGPMILAIDLGTSGPKVALVSATGEVLALEFEEMPLYLLPGGGAEQDPDDWWTAVRRATRRLLARQVVPVESIRVLGCTSQWSGTVAIDREGRPLTNAIIWMDSRGAPYLKPIIGGPVTVEGYGIDKLLRWVTLTGGIPQHNGKDPIAHILYLKHERPDVYQAAACFLEPKDYLNLQLTGKRAASYDSITLHWLTDNRDINRVDYHPGLVRRSTIDRDKLPPLKLATDILGPVLPEVARELGLGEGVQVVMGTPDVQSAAVGSGAVRDFETHLYLGTSSWQACHMPFKKTDIFHNMASLPSAIPGRYLLTTEQESAGACLRFLKDSILYPDDALRREDILPEVYPVFDQIVETMPPGSERLIFTPWLYGERTPIDDHTARGGFHNISLAHQRGHFIRAVFEGVAFNSKWLFTYVEKFCGRRIESLNMIGGGARSAIWCQIYADVLDRTIRQVQDPIQANVRGAAVVAAVAMGYMTFEAFADQVQIVGVYRPDPANRSIYDELYGEFLALYRQNRKIYARLNRNR